MCYFLLVNAESYFLPFRGSSFLPKKGCVRHMDSFESIAIEYIIYLYVSKSVC